MIARAPARVAPPLSWHYTGQLRSSASWSKVGRELIRAIGTLGDIVTATDIREVRYDGGFPLADDIVATMRAQRDVDVQLRFTDPAGYPPRGTGRPVALLVYEATHWPAAWIRTARAALDLVAVPSTFCRDALCESGMDPDAVFVVPHGIDPAVFHPADRVPAGTSERLRLLFVGTHARRKGLDLLLDAYPRAFGPADPVRLVVKLVPYPPGLVRPDLLADWRLRVDALRRQGYACTVIEKVLPESELAALYRSADLLCAPFRGEGFGLPILEAMACGTPVLATAWSGPEDFVSPDTGLLLAPGRWIPARPFMAEPEIADPRAQMVEPAIDALVDLLTSALRSSEGLAARGEAAAFTAAAMTWSAAAGVLRRKVTG